ncbi:MAG: rhodanese-like domain-containing protein [Peptostreptococcaceae bacterium]|nr:rhodanese-like domain-containing protein [Peptostreptococcaceae bacterium]
MKKLFALALAGLLTVGAIGCTKTEQNAEQGNQNQTEQKNDQSTEGSEKKDEMKMEGVQEMTGQELIDWMKSDQGLDTLLLDVRSEEEYLKGSMIGSINYPADHFEEHISEFDSFKELPVIVYGDDMEQSKKAAQALVDNGFQKVFNAQGVKEFKYELSADK